MFLIHLELLSWICRVGMIMRLCKFFLFLFRPIDWLTVVLELHINLYLPEIIPEIVIMYSLP